MAGAMLGEGRDPKAVTNRLINEAVRGAGREDGRGGWACVSRACVQGVRPALLRRASVLALTTAWQVATGMLRPLRIFRGPAFRRGTTQRLGAETFARSPHPRGLVAPLTYVPSACPPAPQSVAARTIAR
jgi:hypothetical protein